MLLVFGCAGDECGRADAAWAAVRVQGEAVAVAVVESPAAARPPPPPPPPPPADDDWGLGAGGGAFGGAAPSSSSLSLADVSAELERAAAALAAAPPPPAARPRDHATAGEPAQRPPPPPCWTPAEWAPPRLVEFYVGWKAEPSPRAPLPPSRGPDDAHVAALLAAYRAAGGDDAEAVPDDDACGGGGGSGAPPAPTTTATASWSGEAYEPDAAPGASTSYLAFAARVAREPGQLARYSLGAPPLWPLAPGRGATSRPPAPPPPPPCTACAASRRWEMALVSPLAALLDEAAEWAGGGKGAPGCPAGWEWTTIAVATCERDCGGASEPGDVVAVQEHVCVANEE